MSARCKSALPGTCQQLAERGRTPLPEKEIPMTRPQFGVIIGPQLPLPIIPLRSRGGGEDAGFDSGDWSSSPSSRAQSMCAL